MISPLSLLHPRLDIIEAFLNGGLSESKRQRLTVHLRDCEKCQRSLLFTKRVTDSARSSADIPPMSHDLRATILESAASGSTRLVAGFQPSETSGRRKTALWPLAAAAVLLIAVMVIPRDGLRAGATAGVLELSQVSADSAPMVDVRYRAASSLPDDRIELRMQSYSKENPFTPTSSALQLVRSSNGEHTARLRLPPASAFVRFSVAVGERIDDNDARGWTMVVEDETGKPLLDGLWLQRVAERDGRWESAASAAKQMVEFYPDNPAGYRYTLFDAMQLAGAASADSVRQAFRPRVAALHRKFAAAKLDPETMWEFAMLGGDARDTTMTRHWRDRMIREYPQEAGTIQLRVFEIAGRKLSAVERLRAFNDLYVETGGQSLQLLSDAFDLAVKSGDSASIDRWGTRLMKFGGGGSDGVAYEYSRLPAFRARGMEKLRELLRVLPAATSVDWETPLRSGSSGTPGRPGQWQLGALGSALLAEGRIDAARDTLRRALALGPNLRILRSLGEAELRAGDTVAAAAAWTWTIADRRTSQALADSLSSSLGRFTGSAAWEAGLKERKAILSSTLLRKAIRRPLDNDASYVSADGSSQSFAQAVATPISIVAFVSISCAPSVSDLPQLAAVAERLRSSGVNVTVLVEGKASQDVIKALAARGFPYRAGFDDRGVISRRLRQNGSPHYFVVENGNMVRFEARRAEDLVAQVEALRVQ